MSGATPIAEALRQDAEMLKDGWQRNLTKLWHSEVVRDAAKDCDAAADILDDMLRALEKVRGVIVNVMQVATEEAGFAEPDNGDAAWFAEHGQEALDAIDAAISRARLKQKEATP